MEANLSFQPAGQGCFYTGLFRNQNAQYSFVYDCGTDATRRYIDDAINAFRASLNGTLDLFILSHAHKDHFNKMSYLFRGGLRVKKVILPYLSPDELRLALIDAYFTGIDPDSGAFLSDPVGYLKELGVEHIYFVLPKDEPPQKGEAPEGEPPDDLPPDTPLEEIFIPDLAPPPDGIEPPEGVHYIYETSVLRIKHFWEFKFFNRERDPAAIADFVSRIEELVGVDFTQGDLNEYLEEDPTRIETEFKFIYEDVFGTGQALNNTSLVVFHSNLQLVEEAWIAFDPLSYYFDFVNFDQEYFGTLLTGDIQMNLLTVDEMVRKWTQGILDKIKVCQIPHHGSGNNSFQPMFNGLSNVRLWVINFGLGNRYDHPKQRTINLIRDNSKAPILLNTQVNPVAWQVELNV